MYLIDCWAHDNHDDGYSDHDGCEAQIHGGLYEYNGKAGVTPSYGSHCVGYNIISRKNINGFYYTGTLRGDEGLNGNALLISCISDGNTQAGYRVSGMGNENVPNSISLYFCLSQNNAVGFKNELATMVISNCYGLNNTTLKEGTITVNNAEIVE